jgi:endonuclease/exonuclease/phosphatase family metal-dependent hydrolase
MRVMTLNIAHGRRRGPHRPLVSRKTAERNLADIGHVLRRVRPDVVGLQEADGPSFWSGNFDHVERLAHHGDYAHHFRGEHVATGLESTWLTSGTALLARRPLANAESHKFDPAFLRPTKGLVVARVEMPGVPGRPVTVASVHLDFLRRRVRRQQARMLAGILQGWPPPYIVMGDMNCAWNGRERSLPVLEHLLGVRAYEPTAADLATYPALWPLWRLDWILISPELEFHSYAVLRDRVSDHRAVVADVRFQHSA